MAGGPVRIHRAGAGNDQRDDDDDVKDDEEVEKILRSFPELNNGALGFHEITALQVAAAFTKIGVTDRVRSLCSVNENYINQGDQLGRTPLHYAALNGNVDLCEFLINSRAETEPKLRYRESNAKATHGNYSKWNKLYAMLPPPDDWGREPLHVAVKHGHVEVVKLLIGRNANVNAEDDKGVTPLLLAGSTKKSKEVFEDIVEVLLKNGASVNKRNCVTGATALFNAVSFKNAKAAKDLLSAGAWLSVVQRSTELHEAASNNSLEILKILLDDVRMSKDDVNRVDGLNRTATYRAAMGGHKESLKLLIERGGDLGHVTKTNETVMDAIFAHVSKPAAFVRELLDDRITNCYGHGARDNEENFNITLDFNILAPRGNDKQMNVISNILVSATEAEKIEIFQHPLIETFLRLKWFKIRQFFFLLIYSYLFFVLSLSTYVILRKHPELSVWMQIMRYFVVISSGGLMLHALIQCILVPRNFLRQYEVWMNLTCTFLSLLVALIGNESLIAGSQDDRDPGAAKSYANNWILHATSVAVLLAWTELMLLIGRFPTYGYYALMFAAVLQNVIKVLLTFVCLVLGFALSFSVQFYNEGPFNDPWCSLVKTTVMMMGEFEYSGLFEEPEDGQLKRLPATSRVIFLLFVILASIVLMNLMVGLAVSDIQGLQQEGHVRRLEKQAEFLRQLEKVISFKAIESKWFPGILQKFLRGKRCIATTFVIHPEHAKGKKDKKFPNELLDSIRAIARRKTVEDDENLLNSASVTHLIDVMKSFIKTYENKSQL